MSKNKSEEIELKEYFFMVILTWMYFMIISRLVQDKIWEYQSERVEVPVHVINAISEQQDLRGTTIYYYLVVEAEGNYEGNYIARVVQDYLYHYNVDGEIMILWINQKIADNLPKSKYKDMDKRGVWSHMQKRGIWKAGIKGVETGFLQVPENRLTELLLILIYGVALPHYLNFWWRIFRKIRYRIRSSSKS